MASKLDNIHHDIGSLRGSFDSFVEELRERHQREDRAKELLENRVHSIERKQWYLSGGFAFAGALLSFFGNRLTRGDLSPGA